MSLKPVSGQIPLIVRRWWPALVMMVLIFFFSSIPSKKMPNFKEFDFSIKKAGHAFGYLLLGRAYFYGLGSQYKKTAFLAWGMAILYAITDEFHQSFVPGRSPRLTDVGIDSLGTLLGLLPVFIHPVRKK